VSIGIAGLNISVNVIIVSVSALITIVLTVKKLILMYNANKFVFSRLRNWQVLIDARPGEFEEQEEEDNVI